MPEPLLDKQHDLLEYLTGSHAIFGGEHRSHRPPPMPQRGLLQLEARFSFEKRMGKIAAVLPTTIAIVEKKRSDLLREFVEECPPMEISQMANAQQFCGFLRARAQRAFLEPAYLVDVAACELALAQVRQAADEGKRPAWRDEQYNEFRRHPSAAFLRCSYDVRTVFQDRGDTSVPQRRDNFIAVVVPPGEESPQVFELAAPAFDLLAGCSTWIGTASLGAAGNQVQLIGDLAKHGLIEVRS